MSAPIDQLMARLTALIDDGLTFGEAVRAFQEREDQAKVAAAVKAARDAYASDDSVGVDDVTVLSEASGGAWVMAWLWVGDDEPDCPGCLAGRTPCAGDQHRPDDMPDPGDHCKDCEHVLTWRGPSTQDWDLACHA